MAVNISVKNSEFNGKSKVLSNMQLRDNTDLDVSIDNISVDNEAEFLNRIKYLDNTNVDKLMEKIQEAADKLEEKEHEYMTVQMMMEEVREQKQPKKNILIKYLPELLVGTLANVISTYICK